MYPRSREKDPGEPKWLGKIEALIIKQTASMSTLTEKLTHIFEEKPDNQDDASSSNPPPVISFIPLPSSSFRVLFFSHSLLFSSQMSQLQITSLSIPSRGQINI